MNLQEVFGKYIGQVIKDPQRPGYDEDDVLNAIRETAAENGLKLRIHWPSSKGDCRHQLDRVNIPVKKEGNGRLYIQKNFWLG